MSALSRWSLLCSSLLAACAASPVPGNPPSAKPTESAEPTPPARPGSSEVAGTTTTAADVPAIEKSYTGQETPTVVVRNAYPVTQHVFIDGRSVGQVVTGQSATFDVARGVHTVTCADSADPDDNPSSVTEAFESGYGYRYEILAK